MNVKTTAAISRQLREIVSNFVDQSKTFTTDDVYQIARAAGTRNLQKQTVVRFVEDLHQRSLFSGPYSSRSVGYGVIEFAPYKTEGFQLLQKTMKVDRYNRITIPVSVIASVGIGPYEEVFVTREPKRILLSREPLGSDSSSLAVDVYGNVKVQLNPNMQQAWSALVRDASLAILMPAA